MTRTLTLAAAALALATPAAANPADILARHAADNGEERVVSFVEQGGFDGGYTTFGTGDPVAALEVALRHAEANDEEQKARHLRARIEAATADAGLTARGSTRDAQGAPALEIALRQAEQSGDTHLARVLRDRLGR